MQITPYHLSKRPLLCLSKLVIIFCVFFCSFFFNFLQFFNFFFFCDKAKRNSNMLTELASLKRESLDICRSVAEFSECFYWHGEIFPFFLIWGCYFWKYPYFLRWPNKMSSFCEYFIKFCLNCHFTKSSFDLILVIA